MRSGGPLLLAASLLVLASCQDATQVLVRFEAEPLTAARADRLRVVIHGQEQSVRLDQAGTLQGAGAQVAFPTTVPVSPLGSDASRTFHIEGELWDADDAIFSEVRLIAGFVENRKRELALVFYDSCIDRFECSWEQTCQEGRCVDAYVPRPGEDAGVPDPGICAESPCRLKSPQCGCADGFACQAETGAPVCQVAGSSGPGEECTDTACNGGLACVAIGGMASPTCNSYCTSDDDCPASFCSGSPSLQAGICLSACDPIAQVGCTDGLTCAAVRGTSFTGGSEQASTACGIVGSASEGTPCSAFSCAPGLVCIDSTMTCVRLCRVGDNSACGSGRTCVAFVVRNIAAGVEYGGCG